MLTGGAVHNGCSAAGVIANHSANHGTAGRGGDWPEEQAIFFQKLVQLISNDAGLHPHPALYFIDFQDVVPMFRHIYHDARTNTLTAQ